MRSESEKYNNLASTIQDLFKRLKFSDLFLEIKIRHPWLMITLSNAKKNRTRELEARNIQTFENH